MPLNQQTEANFNEIIDKKVRKLLEKQKLNLPSDTDLEMRASKYKNLVDDLNEAVGKQRKFEAIANGVQVS